MIAAFVWGKLNNVYVVVVDDAKSRVFYAEFVHQVNEQKEMLIAVGLLLYAIERAVWCRSGAGVGSRGARPERVRGASELV